MRECSNCHHQNAEKSRFCVSCGKPLDDSRMTETVSENISDSGEHGKKKKKILIAAVLILLAAGLAGWFFIRPETGARSYSEIFEEADRYLYELDYTRAEEFFREARDIEPKNPEPYKKLYEIYTVTEKPEQAGAIYQEAKDNLDNESLKNFEEAADVIDAEAEADKIASLSPVTDLGRLDMPPVDIGDEGWVIVRDGKYGMIGADGTLIEEPDKAAWYSYGIDADHPAACIQDRSYTSSGISLPSYGGCPPMGGVNGMPVYTRSSDGQLMVRDFSDLSLKVATSKEIGYLTGPIYLPDQSSFVDSQGKDETYVKVYFATNPYYIYNPSNGEISGPYEQGESASFSYNALIKPDFDYVRLMDWQFIRGPYYVKDGDSFTLFSSDGSKSLEGFDKAVPLSDFSIAGWNGKNMTVYDENLNEIYTLPVESGARTIGNLTPIEIDGKWKLVNLDELEG